MDQKNSPEKVNKTVQSKANIKRVVGFGFLITLLIAISALFYFAFSISSYPDVGKKCSDGNDCESRTCVYDVSGTCSKLDYLLNKEKCVAKLRSKGVVVGEIYYGFIGFLNKIDKTKKYEGVCSKKVMNCPDKPFYIDDGIIFYDKCLEAVGL